MTLIRRWSLVALLALVATIALARPAAAQVREGTSFKFTQNGILLLTGAGDPEGAQVAPVGSFYLRSTGLWYRKNTGSGNTGWQLASTPYFANTDRVMCRDTSGAGAAEECTVSAILDMIGSTRGSLLYRGASGWTILTPGASGECLKSGGTGADPSFGSCTTGAGDVTAAASFGTDNRLLRSDGSGKGAQASGVTLDDSDIVTGLKFDAEGSGNTLTLTTIEKYVTAGCQAGTASLGMNTFTALAPTPVCITGTNVTRGAAQFPDSDGEFHLGMEVTLVPGWTGTADFSGFWRTAATSGDVVLQIQWACTADGEVLNDTWSTAATTTDTAKGTTLQLNAWSITGVSLTGCSPDELIALRIMRQRTHASDSLSGTFDLLPFYGVFRAAK